MKNRILTFIVAALWFAADYFSKVWATETLQQQKIVVNDYMNFALAFNKGAAFSLFADGSGWQRWFFMVVAIVVGLWLCYAIVYEKVPTIVRLAYGFILGGAAGNLYDRIAIGHVIDFIQWHIGNYYWPTFNVADVAITIGVSVLVIMAILDGWRGHAETR